MPFILYYHCQYVITMSWKLRETLNSQQNHGHFRIYNADTTVPNLRSTSTYMHILCYTIYQYSGNDVVRSSFII